MPQPPQPPQNKRRRPIVGIASGLLSFIGIAAIALAVAWSLGEQRINTPGPLPADKAVTIAPGTDVSGIVDQLADEGVVESRPLMTAALWIEGNRGKVKAGEYMFKQAASLRDVIDTLVSGKQILHSITIPEGLTSEQVVDRLRDDDVLAGDIKEVPKEGTLMPDTFKFARGTTRDQVIRNMQAEQKKILADVWARRSPDTPIRSPYELVTLASIVEKETGRADERPRVAGVFVNRLVRNMPLQSDPTIVYGLVGGKGTLGRGILKSELEQKTPYNTYAITGLPPGPIANPGKAALEAVASPSRTKELYFVADGTGGHAFADNLDQHRANVLRWRQIEKDAKDKVSPDADKVTAPVPAGAVAPRSNQRSDNNGGETVYGELPSGTLATALSPQPSRLAAFPFKGFDAAPSTPLSTKPATANAYAPNGNFDELDIEVAGVRSKAGVGDADLDEGGYVADPAQSATGSMATFPVSAQQLADQKARARAYGLQTSNDRQPQPGAVSLDTPNDNSPPISNRRFGKGSIIDASEGTAFDPLRDKSYDLSSAKIVPTIRALPPVVPLATSVN
ncbi:endolytic transglycosylase MltG [Lichenihabitans psoromatis]|uniref:endolytic transglycosylase MltG n=1 Tax=Lichenihabitans psoromatis TaxID=2528642 RepID=UPI001FE0CCD8|nr:endolytic transglycosylase MltG [Lichenihabitans psoromatis]